MFCDGGEWRKVSGQEAEMVRKAAKKKHTQRNREIT